MIDTSKKSPSATAKPVTEKPPVVKKPVIAKKTVAAVKKPVTAATAPATPPAPVAKPAKVKMVRESYSMPEAGHALLTELKKSCLEKGIKVKKGELLRVGLSLLAKLSPADLAKALKAGA